jgi:2-aminobenzoate-CoA ligase
MIHRDWETGLAPVAEAFAHFPGTLDTSYKYVKARLHSLPDPQFADDLIAQIGGWSIMDPEGVPGKTIREGLESVSEVAVVGSPDEQRGEIVKAFVVRAEDETNDDKLIEEIQNHVKNTLAPYKYPRAVKFCKSLPRTETGKIRRTELREQEHE